MSNENFNPSDWWYVADAMGRLGKGYYKYKNNPTITITVAEFEQRRAQPVIVKQDNEQNINKNVQNAPVSPQKVSEAEQDQTLTPWSNPLMGEQKVVEPIAEKELEEKPVTITKQVEKTATTEVKEPAERENPSEGANKGREGGSEKESAKVICTELVAQGLMTASARQACGIYAERCLPSGFMRGYHFWAVPYVRLMRRSSWAVRFIVPFVTHRTREVCYRLGLRKKGSWFGRLICAVHDPVCSLMGKFISKSAYQTLYPKPDSIAV